jgi:hypothetical protein
MFIARIRTSLLILLFLAASAASHAQSLRPLFTETPPAIDGNLNDSVWASAPAVGEFRTFIPYFGKLIDEQTEVRMAYDRENLYFAYRCTDQSPDKIKRSIGNRDNILNDDWVCLNLDSFNDHQGLYALYVNPLGIQADSRFAAGTEDFSIDLVWFSAGMMTPDGYSVEIRIPLKSLRYTDSDPVMMSVFFERFISRRNEHSSYPNLDPAKGDAFLTEMAPLEYHGIEHYTLLEILPAFTATEKFSRHDGEMSSDERSRNFSLTAKYGITSDLILDGTITPDFSQVEADAGQIDINLRSPLFFAEKRPFFLEGKDNFTIGATTISERDPLTDIVYSRTIVDPLTGLRLTGKTGGKENTLASILVLDRIPESDRDAEGKYAGYPILRYKRSLSNDSYVGGIFAGRFGADNWNIFNRRSNMVFGADEQYRVSESGMIESCLLGSVTRETPGSPAVNGYTLGLSHHSSSSGLDYSMGLRDISDNFTADMGYATRTGLTTLSGLLRPKFYPDSGTIRRMDLEFFTAQTHDRPSGLWETFNHVSLQTFFAGSFSLKIKYSLATEIFLGERFNTGGYHAALGGQLFRDLVISILYRRIQSIYYSDQPSQGKSHVVSIHLNWQPSDKFLADGSFLFSDFKRESDGTILYSYPISRLKLSYQANRYLFLRTIGEYNTYRETLTTDFLFSFTYIPGTVFYLGYGSQYERTEWDGLRYAANESLHEALRGYFLKGSYLWRS